MTGIRGFDATRGAFVVAAVLFTSLAVAVAVHRGAPFTVDSALHQGALQGRSDRLTSFARAVTNTGSGLPTYGIAAVAGFLAARGYRWLTGAGSVLLLLVGQGVRLLLATAVDRPRPPVGDWVAAASGGAFPSGHTTTSALVAALVCWAACRRLRGAARGVVTVFALAWAVAVGLTRVYLGVHWPTDVVGGWLLAAVLVGVAVALRTAIRGRFEVEAP